MTRPWQLLVVVGTVALEALELVAAAIGFVVLAIVGGGGVGASLLALSAMFFVLALGLAAVAVSLSRLRRWSRPAAVAWQILLLLFGFSTIGSGWWVAAAALLPAVVCLVFLFSPPVLRAYEQSPDAG